MTNLLDIQKERINGVAFNPADLVKELQAYGEPTAAERMKFVSQEEHNKISALAMKILLREACVIDKAICLAAIEVFEGSHRPLARKRRVYQE
jgi:hypothetical protein